MENLSPVSRVTFPFTVHYVTAVDGSGQYEPHLDQTTAESIVATTPGTKRYSRVFETPTAFCEYNLGRRHGRVDEEFPNPCDYATLNALELDIHKLQFAGLNNTEIAARLAELTPSATTQISPRDAFIRQVKESAAKVLANHTPAAAFVSGSDDIIASMTTAQPSIASQPERCR